MRLYAVPGDTSTMPFHLVASGRTSTIPEHLIGDKFRVEDIGHLVHTKTTDLRVIELVGYHCARSYHMKVMGGVFAPSHKLRL